MSVSCTDGIEVSWLWDAAWNPSPASFPFFYGVDHESAHDCHDTVDSLVSGMAETN